MNKYKIILYTTLSIAVVALTATGAFLNSHAAKKKYATSGVAPHSKAVWSYNKKTKTLTIKPNKNKKKRKANTSDFNYRLLHTKKLVYEDGMHRIGEFWGDINAERDYRGFKNVIIPGSIKRITPYCLLGTANLQTIIINYGVKQIGCYSLNGGRYNELVLPDSMRSIEEAAFEMKRQLKHIDFNDGLKSIGWCAFDYSSLTDAVLPDSVNYIGKQAFECTDISYIKLPDGIKILSEGVLSRNENLKSCNIPESVVEIHYCAFRKTGLERITIPRNVEILGGEIGFWVYGNEGNGIFSNCKSLKRISFKTKKIKTIHEGAMSGISSNTIIEVPTGYKEKYSEMFAKGGLNKNIKIIEVDVNDSDIDSVRLNRDSTTVKEGMPRKMELMYADEPDKVKWESSDDTIVKVNDSGEAMAIKVGDAVVKATYKNRDFTCKFHVTEADSDNDEEELRKLIKYEKELGSLEVDEDIHSNQYEWRNGRLIGINWSELDVAGSINLNPFTYLEYFKSGYTWCGIWEIDADDLEHLNFLGYNRLDIGDDNIHIENAKDIKIERYDEFHIGHDFGDENWRTQESSD
ncbi:MAG: leucine-rich repeat protein [Lachnospiraceae bacterium]|nr:leucine-rich repeat protein [Lachnospiraceae bacterium]